ncbi:PH domain-containing protein [Paenibacillus montanisoli]|nr:PH domain-containing protein [Paenibacillus montanisoli]
MREPTQKLDIKAIRGWRIEAVVEGILIGMGLLLVEYLLYHFQVARIISAMVWVLFGSCALFCIFDLTVLPKLRYKKWRYEVHDTEVLIGEGVLFYERIQIPINRVQHVTLKQGPISRMYKLATLEITTAASSVEIPYLSQHIAESISKDIKQFALLNDEHE